MPATLHRFATPTAPIDPTIWETALAIDAYIAQAASLQALWQSARRVAQITETVRDAATQLTPPVHLLALTEDWCGDAVHTLGVVARIAEAAPRVTLRLTSRDAHPALMEAHLSAGSRSIPVVMALDVTGAEWGWWGPRPSLLQTWVKDEGMALDKDARWKAIRTWYARDRGEATASEVLALLTHAAKGISGDTQTSGALG
ncbi:MAG: thioredoxin family protein [Gemmatimonadaceae bacterium]